MANLNIALQITGSASSGISAVRGISNALTGLGSAATAPVRAIGTLTQAFGTLGMAVFGIEQLARGIGSLGSSLVGGNAQMETYGVQLETLMGSAKGAKDRLAELAEFGAKTPFELPEIVRAEKILLGFGLTGQKALDLTSRSGAELRTVIGDIAAGTGASFEEIALNFGKFSAGATGESISRLQELGIVTREQLRGMGIEFSKSGELLSPLPEAMTAALTIANDKFGGGMDKLSATFEGRMSTLKDNFGAAVRTLTAPLFEVLSPAIEKVNELLGSEGFQGTLKSVAGTIGQVVQVVAGLASGQIALGDVLRAGFEMAKETVLGFGTWLLTAVPRWGTALWSWVQPQIPIVLAALWFLAQSIGQWAISTALPWLQQQFAVWGTTAWQWIATVAVPGIRAALPAILATILDWDRQMLTWLFGVGTGLAQSLIGGLIERFPVLAQAFDFLRPYFDNLVTAFGGLWKVIQANLAPALAAVKPLFEALAPIVGGVLVVAIAGLMGGLSFLANTFATVIPTAIEVARRAVLVIVTAIDGIKAIVGDVILTVESLLSGNWSEAWNLALRTLITVLNAIGRTLVEALNQIVPNWRGAWEMMAGVVVGVGSAILAEVQHVVDALAGMAENAALIFERILAGDFAGAWKAAQDATVGGMLDVGSAIANGMLNVVGAVAGAIGQVDNVFAEGWREIADTSARAIPAVVGPIVGAVALIPAAATSAATQVGESFDLMAEFARLLRESFGIDLAAMGVDMELLALSAGELVPPFVEALDAVSAAAAATVEVMPSAGVAIADGLASGIVAATPAVEAAAANMAGRVIDQVNRALKAIGSLSGAGGSSGILSLGTPTANAKANELTSVGQRYATDKAALQRDMAAIRFEQGRLHNEKERADLQRNLEILQAKLATLERWYGEQQTRLRIPNAYSNNAPAFMPPMAPRGTPQSTPSSNRTINAYAPITLNIQGSVDQAMDELSRLYGGA